jgi:hypothetical protein
MSRNTCWYCGQDSLIWDSDADAEDIDGPADTSFDPETPALGVVSFLHCSNPKCNAQVEYRTPGAPRNLTEKESHEDH